MAATKQADAPASTAADAQVDWSATLTTTEVDTLRAKRTAESVPASIREVADKAYSLRESGKGLQVTLPNGVAVKSFAKHLRDYCYLVEPRRTARITVQPDGVSVSFRVTDYGRDKRGQGRG